MPPAANAPSPCSFPAPPHSSPFPLRISTPPRDTDGSVVLSGRAPGCYCLRNIEIASNDVEHYRSIRRSSRELSRAHASERRKRDLVGRESAVRFTVSADCSGSYNREIHGRGDISTMRNIKSFLMSHSQQIRRFALSFAIATRTETRGIDPSSRALLRPFVITKVLKRKQKMYRNKN